MQGSTFLMQRSRGFTLQHQKGPGFLDRLELTGVLCPRYLSLATHMSFAPNPLYPVVTKPKQKMLLSAEGTLTNHPFSQPRNRETIRPSCPFNPALLFAALYLLTLCQLLR